MQSFITSDLMRDHPTIAIAMIQNQIRSSMGSSENKQSQENPRLKSLDHTHNPGDVQIERPLPK